MYSKASKTLNLTVVAFFAMCMPAFAADGGAGANAWAYLGAGIAAGLATIGGAYGIGRLASSAMEGTARQPEAGAQIRVSMIIAAALIEGFTFAAIIVGFVLAGK